MTEQEITAQVFIQAKEANKKILQKKSDDIGTHDLYADSVEMAEHISYHAVKGKFPEKLFKHRSPNETEKEAEYIKNNYKQHTLPVFVDYIGTITRPFGDGNWSIKYLEEEELYKKADQSFQKYVETELPIYGSLENFVKFILPTIKTIDANGYLAVRPKDIDYKENDKGELVIDGDKLYKPTIFYFESKQVIDYLENEYYLFLSNEKSEVKFGTKIEKTGSIFELYTKEAVFFIKQKGAKTDNEFDLIEFYRHDLDDCQVHQLMGVPSLKGESILWQSPFLYSVDLLDLVAMNANWLQASINKCVFPIPVMFGDPCEFQDSEGARCEHGNLMIDGKFKSKCTSCNGSGLNQRLSPLGTLLIKPATKFEPGETSSTQDPLKFVSPDVHTLEFIREKIQNDKSQARSILHIRDKTKTVNTTQDKTTATEVHDDAKSMYAFIKPISDQIFILYDFLLKAIGEQRYKKSFKKPELSYPKTFDFKSPEDYLLDISNAITNNLPPSFIQTVLMQYINSFYGDNTQTTMIFRLIMQADMLFGMSQDDINMKLARGTAAKWQDILHTSILFFINESLEKDQKFLEKNPEEQIKLLEEKAKAKADEINRASEPISFTTP